MYCRHESGVHPREPLGDLLPAAADHCSALDHHINYLAKRITTFKNLLSGKKEKSKETTVVNYQNGNDDAVEIETKTEQLQIDNKLIYDESSSLTELECANHDHPLKDAAAARPDRIPLITEKAHESIPASLPELEAEVNSVALDWKSIKSVTECSCSTPLDHFSRKHHCWGCGRCVCTRCVSARAPLARWRRRAPRRSAPPARPRPPPRSPRPALACSNWLRRPSQPLHVDVGSGTRSPEEYSKIVDCVVRRLGAVDADFARDFTLDLILKSKQLNGSQAIECVRRRLSNELCGRSHQLIYVRTLPYSGPSSS
ncbi:hypothetical protein MSG28_009104 [Choristoneura fumiferana]|uniref:Uncharacterized protein n=1 Tax=Choristoneura fumiferana TaxID=7141 RepID=A0ACC0KXH1_CHOFU|nr:hypothetical protein MSG28_009104 [Choristoneura fumiferana]